MNPTTTSLKQDCIHLMMLKLSTRNCYKNNMTRSFTTTRIRRNIFLRDKKTTCNRQLPMRNGINHRKLSTSTNQENRWVVESTPTKIVSVWSSSRDITTTISTSMVAFVAALSFFLSQQQQTSTSTTSIQLEENKEKCTNHNVNQNTIIEWMKNEWRKKTFYDILQQQYNNSFHRIESFRLIVVVSSSCEGIYINSQDNYDDDDDSLIDSTGSSSSSSESERFADWLHYHRSSLYHYTRQWKVVDTMDDHYNDSYSSSNTSNDDSKNQYDWPTNIPTSNQIPALLTDLEYCLINTNLRLNQNRRNSMNSNNNTTSSTTTALLGSNQNKFLTMNDNKRTCQDLQFRIASYYVKTTSRRCVSADYQINKNDNDDNHDETESKIEMIRMGYTMLKELAENGHPDSICLLGILLNEGREPVIDTNPQLAVIWWRRCVDEYRHTNAMYELATALYLGNGVVEDTHEAVRMFHRAAKLGHPGAAYMLGECLLDGVGIPRDRGEALQWILTAAELGHRRAQQRVLFLLNEKFENLDVGITTQNWDEGSTEEALKWMNDENQIQKQINIERRHTIGGSSKNPTILARRKTKVAESRDTTAAATPVPSPAPQ